MVVGQNTIGASWLWAGIPMAPVSSWLKYSWHQLVVGQNTIGRHHEGLEVSGQLALGIGLNKKLLASNPYL
jgi:hypothetical protein